jgi:hypothetical protein
MSFGLNGVRHYFTAEAQRTQSERRELRSALRCLSVLRASAVNTANPFENFFRLILTLRCRYASAPV